MNGRWAELLDHEGEVDAELRRLEGAFRTAAAGENARAAVKLMHDRVDEGHDSARHLAWWTDSREAAWDAVHRAEEAVDDATPDALVGDLMDRAEGHARRNLSRSEAGRRVERMRAAATDAERSREARSLVRDSHEAADKRLAGLRALNRANWVATFGLAALLVWLFLGRIGATVVPTGILPADVRLAASDLVLVVLAFGAAGGLLSALATVVRHPGYDDARYHDPRPALMALKVVGGALFGLLGLLLVTTGTGVTQIGSVAGVAVMAVVFGYAQQAVTGMLDARAQGYVEGAARRTA